MRAISRLALASILLWSLSVSATLPSGEGALQEGALEEGPLEDEATLSVKRTIERKLIAPLTEKEQKRSKFSRAGPMPSERRVRVLEAAAQKDARGRAFRTFAVDARRYNANWREDTIVGCLYSRDGSMFVKIGDEYRSASFLLGKKAKKPPSSVCVPGAVIGSETRSAKRDDQPG